MVSTNLMMQLEAIILTDDCVNCHNQWKQLIRNLKDIAEVSTALRPVVRLAFNICFIEPDVYVKTTKNSIGRTKLTIIQQGGVPGNSLINILFPLSNDKVLKSTELNFLKVTVSAIQDDIVVLGNLYQMFGSGDVKEQLYLGLKARVYEFHNLKIA